MVALAVLAILVVAVVPSFMGFRQRTVLEGAAEQLVSVWSEARFEALRRDRNLFVTLRNDSGNVCIGVDTDSACDCRVASTVAGACDVSAYPGDNSAWSGVTAVWLPTLGGPDAPHSGV